MRPSHPIAPLTLNCPPLPQIHQPETKALPRRQATMKAHILTAPKCNLVVDMSVETYPYDPEVYFKNQVLKD